MAELPENLQVVKLEEHTPETEAQPTRLIKERLNLHVKRRLQQEHESPQRHQRTHPTTITSTVGAPPTAATTTTSVTDSQQLAVNVITNDIIAATSKRREKQQQKEPTKTRRPYQKRTDKNTKIQTQIQAQLQAHAEARVQTQKQIVSEDGRGRKNKRHKGKHLGAATVGTAVFHSNSLKSSSGGSLPLSPGGIDECDGNELESRDAAGRDKDKCPDILSMVLSVKKRALLQDAEVQEFLGRVMDAFKN